MNKAVSVSVRPSGKNAVREFFRPGGPLARFHPQYEFRPGQLAMAEEVAAALEDRKHLLVEAGTGTGKTLAYLVPVIASGKRVIVSTGTKNLQEQLFFKDIPFLQKHMDREIRVAYMKGRNNYLCRQKLYESESRPMLNNLAEIDDFSMIRAWEKESPAGDRAELRKLPADSSVWAKLDARRELCSGQKCEQFERCFLTLMHQRAAESDIIIVNHHLFFADLALREDDYASIIPDYEAVVFDEAHEMEEVAGQHFGVQISNYRVDELARDIQGIAFRMEFGSNRLDKALDALRVHANAFFTLFEGRDGRNGFRDRAGFAQRQEKQYFGLLNALEGIIAELALVHDRSDEVIPLERRAKEIDQHLRFLVEGEDQRYVFWVETRGRGVFLQATPIDVAELLTQRLFNEVDTVVMTSARIVSISSKAGWGCPKRAS
jgi:ATP-dependent DNA helicase DinG